MKQITNSHENQNFQQAQNFNPWAGIKDPEPQKEEDIVWLTPDEFMEEMKVLLRKIFDERYSRIQ
ncbi:MAG: hypothetical protein LBH91_08485 [Prevotellaceae bacterium]|jgi:hypothetical protein|nr:hypothetical protein [Prevotellaceae bacterium]